LKRTREATADAGDTPEMPVYSSLGEEKVDIYRKSMRFTDVYNVWR